MSSNEKDDPSGGEFTRLFRGLESFEPKPASPPSKPADPAAQPPLPPPKVPKASPIPEQAVTKRMTRLFSAKAQPQRPERASVPPPFETKPDPGDFTQMFRPVEPGTPPPVRRPPENPPQPGEFTRMFSVPLPARTDPDKAQPEPKVASPGGKELSFTDVFRTPQFPPAGKEVNWKELENEPAPPSNRGAGEFTQMFERSKTPAPTPGGLSPAAGIPDGAGFPKPPGRSFETTLQSDDFARVVAERPRSAGEGPTAPAAVPQAAAAASREPARKAPQLWVLAVVIAIVVILALAAIYVFVLRR